MQDKINKEEEGEEPTIRLILANCPFVIHKRFHLIRKIVRYGTPHCIYTTYGNEAIKNDGLP